MSHWVGFGRNTVSTKQEGISTSTNTGLSFSLTQKMPKSSTYNATAMINVIRSDMWWYVVCLSMSNIELCCYYKSISWTTVWLYWIVMSFCLIIFSAFYFLIVFESQWRDRPDREREVGWYDIQERIGMEPWLL